MYFKPQKLILSSQKYRLVVQELRRDTGLKKTLPKSWISDLIQESIKHRIPSVICNPALNNQKVSKCLIFFCFLFRIFSLIWRAWGLLKNGTGKESRSFARPCLAMWRNNSPSAWGHSTRTSTRFTSAPCSWTPTSPSCWPSGKKSLRWISWRPSHLLAMLTLPATVLPPSAALRLPEAAALALPTAAALPNQCLAEQKARTRRAVRHFLKGFRCSTSWRCLSDSWAAWGGQLRNRIRKQHSEGSEPLPPSKVNKLPT